MKAKTKHRKRLPPVTWVEKDKTSTGNQTWESRDGMLRLIHSVQCYGIAVPPRWNLWRFKAGRWLKVTEGRGRPAIDKRAREIAAEYDSEDGDE